MDRRPEVQNSTYNLIDLLYRVNPKLVREIVIRLDRETIRRLVSSPHRDSPESLLLTISSMALNDYIKIKDPDTANLIDLIYKEDPSMIERILHRIDMDGIYALIDGDPVIVGSESIRRVLGNKEYYAQRAHVKHNISQYLLNNYYKQYTRMYGDPNDRFNVSGPTRYALNYVAALIGGPTLRIPVQIEYLAPQYLETTMDDFDRYSIRSLLLRSVMLGDWSSVDYYFVRGIREEVLELSDHLVLQILQVIEDNYPDEERVAQWKEVEAIMEANSYAEELAMIVGKSDFYTRLATVIEPEYKF